ncbi:MAG: YhjD/YihY/BrkB family envelope integrity protein, partial [Actinomycetota bacterium]|nr:YhjD/YihY/BrkB family envelope integrity protein [Actinomycetota bacterium]
MDDTSTTRPLAPRPTPGGPPGPPARPLSATPSAGTGPEDEPSDATGASAPGSTADAPTDRGLDDPAAETPPTVGRPVVRNLHRVVWRTIVKAWDDGIVGMAAQGAFWQALSLPPLLLGLLGSVGYIAGWFGPDTVDVIYERIIALADRTFSGNVVDEIIRPTVDNVLGRGRVVVISAGFLVSLWAGSSAVSCFVASIVRAHGQHEVRNPVWQRFFALFLYMGFLIASVFVLPLVALGPNYLHEIVPDSWDPIITQLIDFGYF